MRLLIHKQVQLFALALSVIVGCICGLFPPGASSALAVEDIATNQAANISNASGQLLELSVEEAVLMALQRNRDLKVRRFEPEIAATFEDIERGRFDVELFAEAEYFEEEASETSRSTGEQFSVLAAETSQELGVRALLPTGTSLEALVNHQRNTSNRAPEQQEARLELSATQSLLRGFGPTVNLAGVRQAELGTLASQYELRGYTEALLAETEVAYWQYVLAEEEIEIFEKSLAVARQQKEEVELRIEVGILPQIEAAAVKAEESLRVQALIDAQSLLEERRLRMLRLLNPTADVNFDSRLVATSDPRIQATPITDVNDRLRLAERSRPDLNEARLQMQQNRLETAVTRNGVLPRLELFITLGKTGFADSFSNSFRELDGETYDLSTGVRLSHFLGQRESLARRSASQSRYQQSVEAVDNLRQLIHLDVQLAVNEVERARKQIEASRATRVLQEQTVHAEKERFDVGTATALDVALAQRDLLHSRIAEIESIIHYRIALVELYLAEGSLLERRGIQVRS